MSDQLQALLQQTGLMTPAFPANSRYNTTPITSLTSPNYQFYLSYLKLLGLVRDFHNNFLLPFWNVTADGLWNQHKDKITARDPKSFICRLPHADRRLDYGSSLGSLIPSVK